MTEEGARLEIAGVTKLEMLEFEQDASHAGLGGSIEFRKAEVPEGHHGDIPTYTLIISTVAPAAVGVLSRWLTRTKQTEEVRVRVSIEPARNTAVPPRH